MFGKEEVASSSESHFLDLVLQRQRHTNSEKSKLCIN